MSLETPQEAVEASKDRFDRAKSLHKQAADIEGQVKAIESRIERMEDTLSEEVVDGLNRSCANLRSDATTLQTVASEFLDAEPNVQALLSMVATYTSDLSEAVEMLPDGRELGPDIEPVATEFEDLCELIEFEVRLVQAVLKLAQDAGGPSIDDSDGEEETLVSMISKLEEMQSKRQANMKRIDEKKPFSDFELTETAFFEGNN